MYQNPVLDVAGIDQGDPAVLEYRGIFYLYHTGGHSVRVYKSSNLTSWVYSGEALRASTKPAHWAGIDLWAPEVIYAEGKFYMYVSGALKIDGRGDDSVRRIGVAVASSPEGPFVLEDHPLTKEWSIDAHPFLDSDGTWYMFYNVRNAYTRGPNGVIGCGNVVDKMVDFTTLQGKPSFVCKPDFPWEGDLEGTWFWNEGSFAIKRFGTYYQMYSGGCYYQSTYHLGYATSSVCRGEGGMEATNWQKWPDGESVPVLQSNSEVWGPGHHVVALGPNGVHLYAVYHGHVGEDKTRTTFIDPMYWRGPQLYISGPTAHMRPGPFMPSITMSSWAVDKEEMISSLPEDKYLWEGWWIANSPLEFILARDDVGQESVIRVGFDEGSHLRAEQGEEYRWRIIKDGRRFSFALNGVEMLRGSSALRHGCVGIRTERPLEMKGVRFTRFFSQSFTTKAAQPSSQLIVSSMTSSLEDWNCTKGTLKVTEQGLVGTDRWNIGVRGHGSQNYELSASVIGIGRAGVIPLFVGEHPLVVTLGMADQILCVQETGKEPLVKEVEMEHWNERGAQHLQTRYIHGKLEVRCNGWLIAEIPISTALASKQIGLVVDDVGIIDMIEYVELVAE